MVIDDLNAKIGNENAGFEIAIGYDKINENGERLVDFCLDFDLVMGRALFENKDTHKLT